MTRRHIASLRLQSISAITPTFTLARPVQRRAPPPPTVMRWMTSSLSGQKPNEVRMLDWLSSPSATSTSLRSRLSLPQVPPT